MQAAVGLISRQMRATSACPAGPPEAPLSRNSWQTPTRIASLRDAGRDRHGHRAKAQTDQEGEAPAAPPEEIVDYFVVIEDWDFSYWLALNALRNALDPYHEHRHVELKGRMLRPAGLKTDRVEVSLFPSIGLAEEHGAKTIPALVLVPA